MNHQILIVEDEPSIVITLEFLLKQKGFTPLIARDGNEAMIFLENHQPDLVILDVMLPGKNGYEICQSIRHETRLDRTKVLLLTAKGRVADVEKGKAVGADAYLTKPFAIQSLMDQVDQLLAN
ncbi:MAG: response regulator [Bacteroidetes Order II. Incertae sedis bacterium]|nr:response regulator [Bacteroidetes Order II. bacterium]